MNLQKTEKKDYLVTQSNQLVEANYSSNLTTLAHKVAKLILSFINPEDDNKNISINIEIEKLKYYLGWSKGTKWNRFQSDLKDISKRLNKEPIEIRLEDGKLLTAFFLSSYTLDFKNGIISFDIAPKLVPHLTNLKKNFTTYQLKYIPSLTSSYAIRMYELFYQYKKIGKRKFTIDDFVKKVGASSKYKYNDLKKRVILPAQKQLKQNTDLAFIFSEHKTGKRITSIEFIIFGNTPSNDNDTQLSFLETMLDIDKPEENSAFSEKIIRALNNLGISEQNIAKYFAKGFDIIEDEKKRDKALERCRTIGNYYLEKLDLLSSSPSAQTKDNSAGFLIKALTEDWISTKNKKLAKQKKYKEEKAKANKNIKLLEKKISSLNEKREKMQSPIIANLLSDNEIASNIYKRAMGKIGENFKNGHKKLLSKSIIEQYNSNPFIESFMNSELHDSFPDKFKIIEDLDNEIDTIKLDIEQTKKTYHLS